MSEIITAIRQAVKSMIKPDLLIGSVESFDSTKWTINVSLNIGAKVEDVTIKSVLNGEDSGIFIEPVIGSKVLVGMNDGKLENLTVLVYSEIKSIKLAPTGDLTLRSVDFGGLVKIQQLESNLNNLKTAIENLKSAISTGITSIGVGPTANGATGAAAFNTAAASIQIQFQDMENKKVKHG
ncbi:MAG: hypothetical protein ORN50_04725 [Crocinitomicaceae bacterium]|nr:hypothetical protein [Crocinitomicaceae bacterium]